ncbi:MAG: T9SS type A sorting domain-containing protein [Calditrichaeota bacterium]|nr:T9SS type A sorting domain-containing protein [Calditrichota bacterium]
MPARGLDGPAPRDVVWLSSEDELRNEKGTGILKSLIHMRDSILRGILCTMGIFLWAGLAAAQPLEDCYHTREELYQFVLGLETNYPQFVKVDSIGHSRGQQLGIEYPVYAVKISDNVATFEDEPVVLIIAHIHAEEVAGMEATIRFMEKMVAQPQLEPYRTIRNNVQLYIVPTINPDGLEVISQGWDNTYRKNGYVPPEMHLDTCTIVPGVGEDSCGVDLNRNFSLNWIYGDSIWVRQNAEPFDYYRGPAPFSEPETQAVRDLAIRIKPTTSIVWHASRSGNVAERCIVAWKWGPENEWKFPPDSAAIASILHAYADTTQKYPIGTGSTTYQEVFGATRNGDLQDWFYRELGTIQILTETSPSTGDIQPPCDTLASPGFNLRGLTNTLLPPMEWICRRVINYSVNGDMLDQKAPLNIYTKNSATEQPISAEYRIVDTWSPILNPWYTNEEFGRATILRASGQVTVMARKEGFVNDTVSATLNPGGLAVNRTLYLDPLPWYNVNLNIVDDGGQPIPATVYFDNGFPQTYDVNGSIALSKPLGQCVLRIEPQQSGKIARWFHFWLDRDTTLTYRLPSGTTLMSEDFEDGMTGWTTGGTGGAWRTDIDTTSLNYGITMYTNPEGYRAQYGDNWDATFTRDAPVDLTGGDNAFHLAFDRMGRLDMPTDSFLVEVSVNGSDWQLARGFSDLEVPWTRTFCDLSPWSGNSVYVRFRLKTDDKLGDLGIHFDNIEIVGGLDTDSPRQPLPFPMEYKLTKVYPNPFNPSTTIAYEAPGSGPVEFTIHNLLGQTVWSSVETPPSAGHYELRWSGTSRSGAELSSGIYFVRMSAKGKFRGTQKLMFLK